MLFDNIAEKYFIFKPYKEHIGTPKDLWIFVKDFWILLMATVVVAVVIVFYMMRRPSWLASATPSICEVPPRAIKERLLLTLCHRHLSCLDVYNVLK